MGGHRGQTRPSTARGRSFSGSPGGPPRERSLLQAFDAPSKRLEIQAQIPGLAHLAPCRNPCIDENARVMTEQGPADAKPLRQIGARDLTGSSQALHDLQPDGVRQRCQNGDVRGVSY